MKSDRVFGDTSSSSDDNILDEARALVKEDWGKLFALIKRMTDEVVVISNKLVTYNVELDASAKKMKGKILLNVYFAYKVMIIVCGKINYSNMTRCSPGRRGGERCRDHDAARN